MISEKLPISISLGIMAVTMAMLIVCRSARSPRSITIAGSITWQ